MPPVAKKKKGETPVNGTLQATSPNEEKVAAAVKPPESQGKVLYPKIDAKLYSCADLGPQWAKSPLTVAIAKKLLLWEDEETYATRRVKEDPSLEKIECQYHDDFLLKDLTGMKVKCANNCTNRPINEKHYLSLAQDILKKKFKLNLENIIISRTGKVTSGQHRLIALILAWQMWAGKNKAMWQEYWPVEPYLETMVAFGGSDDPEVLQTVDNVRPRSLSDVFYTTGTLQGKNNAKGEFVAYTPSEKREMARMLESAVTLLWERTGADFSSASKYQTHSTSMEFLSAHPKLMDCVNHIFEENKERSISKLKLSAGRCAALMYLEAACLSDSDTYRNASPRSEKVLDFNLPATTGKQGKDLRPVMTTIYERAAEFWVLLAAGGPAFRPVRLALGSLVDAEVGNGGRETEKFSVLGKAWNCFVRGQDITEEDVTPQYSTDEDGVHHLLRSEYGNFGGIDEGDPQLKARKAAEVQGPKETTLAPPTAPSNEEAAKIRLERAKELTEKLKKAREDKKAKDAAATELPEAQKQRIKDAEEKLAAAKPQLPIAS